MTPPERLQGVTLAERLRDDYADALDTLWMERGRDNEDALYKAFLASEG